MNYFEKYLLITLRTVLLIKETKCILGNYIHKYIKTYGKLSYVYIQISDKYPIFIYLPYFILPKQ